MNEFKISLTFVLGLVVIMASNTASAQTTEEIEALWPCPQRYVDSLYPDVYWPEATMLPEGQWRDDRAIRKSASILADEYSSEEDIGQAITLVKNEYKDDTTKGMQLLFLASIDALNSERSKYLKAIISREKSQLELAISLEDTLNGIDTAQASDAANTAEQLEALNVDLEWQQRIFQQRNDQISTMCELPVDVEQRASDVAQTLRHEAHKKSVTL